MPSDLGGFLTADAFKFACRRHGVQHRKICPDTPKINGMIESLSVRVQRDVLEITLYGTAT